MKAFIPKQNSELPDYYEVTIHYVTGDSETYKVAGQMFMPEMKLFEITTFENKINTFPLTNIKRIEYDSNFSKLFEARKKEHEETQKRLSGEK